MCILQLAFWLNIMSIKLTLKSFIVVYDHCFIISHHKTILSKCIHSSWLDWAFPPTFDITMKTAMHLLRILETGAGISLECTVQLLCPKLDTSSHLLSYDKLFSKVAASLWAVKRFRRSMSLHIVDGVALFNCVQLGGWEMGSFYVLIFITFITKTANKEK